MALFESRNAESAADSGSKRTRATRRTADSVEDMRRRARHRLIGACLLVLTAIIVFPLLFDTEPRQVPINAQVSVVGGDNAPASTQVAVVTSSSSDPHGLADDEEVVDTATASSTPPQPDPAAAGTPPAAPNTAKPPAQEPTSVAAQRAQERRNQQQSAAEAAKQREAAKPAQPPKPPPEKPAAKPPAEPPTQVAAATPPPPAVKPPPAQSSTTARDEAARARALLEGRPVENAAPASRTDEGRFIVQVGAFSDEAKVRQIRQQLEGLGLRTYTQVVQTGGGRATRVRVGPFASRAEADRAAARVKGANLPAAIMSM